VPLAAQDAFPAPIARDNQFQRRVTLLSYLNDVAHVSAAQHSAAHRSTGAAHVTAMSGAHFWCHKIRPLPAGRRDAL
jgi:hypothetical protein